jgi:phage regulator Rha-like protein
MQTDIMKFEFNQHEVDFEQTNEKLMVNATQMAKIFDKQVVAFLRNDDTKNFIEECLKSENSHFLGIEKEEDLVISVQKSGTWMHRILALKFAAWLNPAFELWVYSTIDELLFGRYRRMEENLKKTAKIKSKMELLRERLIDNDDFQELERLELEYKQTVYQRRAENHNQLELLLSVERIA